MRSIPPPNRAAEFKAKGTSGPLSCKLNTPALQERKATVIARLKGQIVECRETANGYALKFPGTDEVLDQLMEFIKTERECCDFFVFTLSIGGDKTEAWLEMCGAEGVKEFITTEIGLTDYPANVKGS